MAASETIPLQEIADLQAEPRAAEAVAPSTEASVVSQSVKPAKLSRKYQNRMNLIVRRWRTEQDISRALNALVDKYDQLQRRQRAQIVELEKAVNRALDLRDQYARKLRERMTAPPLQPKFHHERQS